MSERRVRPIRVLFALPGLHRMQRGAEVAFESLAAELARLPGVVVTLIGSGRPREGEPYRFVHAGCVGRERFERWPRMPLLRDEYVYEELTWVPRLWRAYDPGAYDVTVTCSYPCTNWVLRGKGPHGRRPAHVFVTQNSDWPAWCDRHEFGFFGCDGLVCTNPEYERRNRSRYLTALIPNGVDPTRFRPGVAERAALGLPEGRPLALMVSALIRSKRVVEGIQAAARVPGLHLVVAGDGPMRGEVDRQGRELMGERFHRCVLPRDLMPELYRAADVFLHMSLNEPSANAYIEALATGLPIVTHDREVTRWTLEDAALLVDTNDPGAVAEALGEALEEDRVAMTVARRELVERRFTWRRIADEYRAHMERVLECKKAGGHE